MNPRIRFKGENASEFPDWNCSQIESILTYERPDRYIVKTKIKSEGKVPVLTANKSFILGYTDEDDGIYKRGDVIIFDDFTCDCKLVNFSFKVKSSAIKLLTTDEKQYSLKFVFEAIKRLNIQPKGHQRHWISFVQKQKLFIPSLEEQQKIASFFSTLDQKIELNERKLEALEKLKKGVTQKILNKKIRFQKDDGTDFPDTVSCSLRDISAYSKCIVEKKNSLFIGNEQLISNFGGATLNFREVAKGNEFNSGDILFGNIRPYLKKVWLSNESGVASPDVLIFKATNAIPGYLKFILSSERFFNHVAQGYKGSKMPRGDKHQIMDFSIQCPCLEEQQKIADFLSVLDSKIDIKRKTVATMRDLKRGLMQQMFV